MTGYPWERQSCREAYVQSRQECRSHQKSPFNFLKMIKLKPWQRGMPMTGLLDHQAVFHRADILNLSGNLASLGNALLRIDKTA